MSISWRSPLPGIYSSIYLKQGGGVFRLAGMPGGLVLLLHDQFPTHPAPYFHQPNFEVFAFHTGGATLGAPSFGVDLKHRVVQRCGSPKTPGGCGRAHLKVSRPVWYTLNTGGFTLKHTVEVGRGGQLEVDPVIPRSPWGQLEVSLKFLLMLFRGYVQVCLKVSLEFVFG